MDERRSAAAHGLLPIVSAGIGADDKGLDLVKRIYAQGIKILWILPLKYPPNVPVRP